MDLAVVDKLISLVLISSSWWSLSFLHEQIFADKFSFFAPHSFSQILLVDNTLLFELFDRGVLDFNFRFRFVGEF